MVASKQAGSKGTIATRLDSEDPPSKDHRVAGAGPRLLLLYKKATSSIPGPWDKVGDQRMLAAAALSLLSTVMQLLRVYCVLIVLFLLASFQEDLLDVLYWLRQLIAVLAGVAWGLVPLTGLYAFLGCGAALSPFALDSAQPE